MEKVTDKEIISRLERFQEGLRKKGIEAAVVLQRADLYYLSGTGQNAHLIVPAEGEPVLLVRKSLERASGETPLKQLYPFASMKDLPAYLSQYKTIGLELDVLPVNLYERYRSVLPQAEFCDVSGLIKQLRMVKSPYEVAQHRKAAEILNNVMLSVPRILRPGISEVALTGELEAVARAQGSQGYMRMRSFNQEMNFAHILSGANAAYPSFFDGPTGGLGLGAAYPQGPSLESITPGVPIIMDICLAFNGYIVDQTRMASLGRTDSFFSEVYQRVLELQEEVVSKAKPGVIAGELHELALAYAKKLGLEDNFMGFKADRAGFLGHGVGLELDELPVLARGLKTVLEPGMVFAMEPKFVFPGRGVTGIENTFLVTASGLEKITFSSEEIIEVL